MDPQLESEWALIHSAKPGHWLRTEAAIRSLVLKALQVKKSGIGPYDHVATKKVTPHDSISVSTESASEADHDFVVDLPKDDRTNCRAKVYWPEDKVWYEGQILSVEPGGGPQALCLMVYDDGGMREWINPSGGDQVEFYPRAAKWVSVAHSILDTMRKQKSAGPFLYPVDVSQAPGYLQVIAQPMDFHTIASKLHAGAYPGIDAFASDVRLVFSNCWLYNANSSPYFKAASDTAYKFERAYEKSVRMLNAAQEQDSPVIPPTNRSKSAEKLTSQVEEAELEIPMTLDEIRHDLPLKTDPKRFEVPRFW